MDDALRVHVLEGGKQFSHVVLGHFLTENLVFLNSNLLEQLSSVDIFHDQVDELLVDVGLVVFHDVWMVQLRQYCHFFLDSP